MVVQISIFNVTSIAITIECWCDRPV